MKILLDECVDRRLAKHLPDLTVRTVADMGWSGIKNGELLALAEFEFDVFITVDRNLSFQQHQMIGVGGSAWGSSRPTKAGN